MFHCHTERSAIQLYTEHVIFTEEKRLQSAATGASRLIRKRNSM